MSARTLSRRYFLQVSAGAGAGLVLGCYAKGVSTTEKRPQQKFSPNAFVQVDPNGDVTITVSKPEIGQGSRTALAMIVAEELGVDWQKVIVKQAPANRAMYGGQSVGGSGSVRGLYGQLRGAGATAAYMLRSAAAQKWGAPIEECRIENGIVARGNDGQRLPFGELATAAAALAVPSGSQITLKSKSDFTLIGKPTKRVDNKAVVTGKAMFGLDTKVPGMLYAVIARPVAFGGRAESFDDSGAKAVPGVRGVFQLGPGVAVVADSTWAALKGRDALKVTWNNGDNANLDSAELTRRFQSAVQPFPDMPAGALKVIEATYELPYLSHAPMETMNCTAHVQGDRCEIWVPTQVPDSGQQDAAQTLGIPLQNVTLNVTMVGGGFGRRLSTEYIAEAVQISKQVGAPVQLLWTRDDDMRHDHYRPATYHVFKGAVDSSGMPLAYYQQSYAAGGGGGRRGGGGDWGQPRISYKVPNGGAISGGIQSPVPTGAWRSVENTYHCFVTESFFDELCVAGGKDPMDVRLATMTDGRLKRTLELAKEKSEWGKPLPKGWGRGVASFNGYGSLISEVAEVEVTPKGQVKVHRVVAAVDCGLAINPLGVEAQVQGATVDAVSTTLYAACTIGGGGVVQTNLGDFGWAKMSDAPKVEVHIIADQDNPGGMGEVGYPAAVPAIVNAIANACGKRARKLPIRNSLA